MKTINLTIQSISSLPSGDFVVVTNSSEANAKGVWTQSPSQIARLARNCGVSVEELLLVAAGGTFTFQGKAVKEGDTWENGEETGTYSKDHFRTENHSIALSMQAKTSLLVAKAAARSMFGEQAPVSTEKTVVAEEEPFIPEVGK